jgi:hypothetical protein
MTSPRRQRKSRPAGTFLVLGVALFFGSLLLLPGPIGASTSTRVVSDWRTGLAIDGIDPVGYFTDSQPLLGKPEFEFRHEGVVWRFRNDGNRAAFVQNPEVYMPRYGGYDPVAVARGVAVAGNPLLWVLTRQRRYLFFSNAARAQFATNSDKIVADAEAKWPDVSGTLAR